MIHSSVSADLVTVHRPVDSSQRLDVLDGRGGRHRLAGIPGAGVHQPLVESKAPLVSSRR